MARTGRPSKLDDVVGQRQDGTPLTVADQIVDRIRLGMRKADAARSAGVSRSTLHAWSLEGARLRALQAQGKLRKPTARQTKLIDFSDAVDRAEEEAIALVLGTVQRAALAGATSTKRTRKLNPAGQVIEETVVTEVRPSERAAIWWLEHVPSDRRYATRVELTGKDGQPLREPERAHSLADDLEAYLAGVRDAEVEQAAE